MSVLKSRNSTLKLINLNIVFWPTVPLHTFLDLRKQNHRESREGAKVPKTHHLKCELTDHIFLNAYIFSSKTPLPFLHLY